MFPVSKVVEQHGVHRDTCTAETQQSAPSNASHAGHRSEAAPAERTNDPIFPARERGVGAKCCGSCEGGTGGGTIGGGGAFPRKGILSGVSERIKAEEGEEGLAGTSDRPRLRADLHSLELL